MSNKLFSKLFKIKDVKNYPEQTTFNMDNMVINRCNESNKDRSCKNGKEKTK